MWLASGLHFPLSCYMEPYGHKKRCTQKYTPFK